MGTISPLCASPQKRHLSIQEPPIELDGNESIDHVVAILKEGKQVVPRETIANGHGVYLGVQRALDAEYPVAVVQDYISMLPKRAELLSNVLLKRSLWEYTDFVNPIENSSYGEHNNYFDTYQWSTKLWKEFQAYVDVWYPTADHTHLRYSEYKDLMRYFYYKQVGIVFPKLLPRHIRMRPAYGVPVPQFYMKRLWGLYDNWLDKFTKPLHLRKALVLNGGCGLSGFVTRQHCPLVRVVDPLSTAVESIRSDCSIVGHQFKDMSFSVGDIDAEIQRRRKFHMVTYFPNGGTDVTCSNPEEGNFRVSAQRTNEELEVLFSKADQLLEEQGGVLVIATTNLQSLLNPLTPHPIENELKHNRRWVLLDYYDVGLKDLPAPAAVASRLPRCIRDSLRCELWVLHRVEQLHHFGWIHGIPGCQPPATAAKWKTHTFWNQRQKAIKEQVESMGEDWGTYKTRLLNLMNEENGIEEDDSARAVRMALDPEYGWKLAEEAKTNVMATLERKRVFSERVASTYKGEMSPREAFDRQWS